MASPATSMIDAPHALSVPEVMTQMNVSRDEGLSEKEAAKRQVLYGENVLAQGQQNTVIHLFLDRFRDILVVVLLIACALSLIFGHIQDAIIIAAAIAIDASLSFVQVWRTEKTLAKLRQHVADTITVLRNGAARIIPSSQLVPGDIIEIRSGEKVPADARIIRAQGMSAHEAILTGESSDIAKSTARLPVHTLVSNRSNMVFAGTDIVSGSGTAIVGKIGTQTEFGKIAQMLRQQRSPDSPLRRKLQEKSLQIGWIIIAAVLLLTLLGLLQGQGVVDTGRTAITLIVSAIPEDLTMILTITLTVSVARILRRHGVVRNLSSAETLGATTVICTDKTGTLTEGKMKASGFHFLQGESISPPAKSLEPLQELALIGLALANDAHKPGKNSTDYVGSATERTAQLFVDRWGWNQGELRSKWRTKASIPFHTRWKYRVTLADHPTQSTQVMFVAGAPDVLLQLSSQTLNKHSEPTSLTSRRRFELMNRIEALAGQGQRLIAVAVKRHLTQIHVVHSDVKDLLFLGVLSITDPIRFDIRSAIAQTVSAGVAVKLVTGDHAATARAIARQIGLTTHGQAVLEGETLRQLDDRELIDEIESNTIFARVEPLDKQRIIRLLQQRGHVVAMTGDGVNDAVALKAADIGVAMGTGSDIARDAADLVLLDNSFLTIVAAIKEGRVLRDNIRKVLAFLLATNAAEVVIFFVSILSGLPLPLLPAQILWINLVTDGTSDIALSLEPAEDNVMKRRPEDPKAPLFNARFYAMIAFSGLVMTVGTMLLYWYSLTATGQNLAYARTMAFTFLSVASLLSVWSFRSLSKTFFESWPWQNAWVPISGAFSFGLQALAIYVPSLRRFFHTVPLQLNDWFIIIGLALVTILIIDMRKIIFKHPQTEQRNLSAFTHLPARYQPAGPAEQQT